MQLSCWPSTTRELNNANNKNNKHHVSFLELALKHGAVILAPDYRLRPEHEIVDGVEDTRSFWKWVEREMPRVVHQSLPSLEMDLSNLLVCGESSGGCHAAQTALLDMTSLSIKALFLQYPVVDLGGFCRMPETRVEEAAKILEMYPYSLVEEHMAAIEPGKICSRAKFGTRGHLCAALLMARQLCDLSGDKAWIDPMISLETAGNIPPILLYHSKGDQLVSSNAGFCIAPREHVWKRRINRSDFNC